MHAGSGWVERLNVVVGQGWGGSSPKHTLELLIIVVNISHKLQHVGVPPFTLSLLGTGNHYVFPLGHSALASTEQPSAWPPSSVFWHSHTDTYDTTGL